MKEISEKKLFELAIEYIQDKIGTMSDKKVLTIGWILADFIEYISKDNEKA